MDPLVKPSANGGLHLLELLIEQSSNGLPMRLAEDAIPHAKESLKLLREAVAKSSLQAP